MRKRRSHFRNSCNLLLISGLRGGVSINLEQELQKPTCSQRKWSESLRMWWASYTYSHCRAGRSQLAGMNGAYFYNTDITGTCICELQWQPHVAGYCLAKNREVWNLEVIVLSLASSSEIQIAALKNAEHLAKIKNKASVSSRYFMKHSLWHSQRPI